PRRHRDPGFRWSVRRGFPMTEPSTDTSQISPLESDPESRDRKRGRRPRRRTYSLLGWLWESIPGPLVIRPKIAIATVAVAVAGRPVSCLYSDASPCAVPSTPWVHAWAVGPGGTVGCPPKGHEKGPAARCEPGLSDPFCLPISRPLLRRQNTAYLSYPERDNMGAYPQVRWTGCCTIGEPRRPLHRARRTPPGRRHDAPRTALSAHRSSPRPRRRSSAPGDPRSLPTHRARGVRSGGGLHRGSSVHPVGSGRQCSGDEIGRPRGGRNLSPAAHPIRRRRARGLIAPRVGRSAHW